VVADGSGQRDRVSVGLTQVAAWVGGSGSGYGKLLGLLRMELGFGPRQIRG
jgi:hypothetical protein